MRRRPSRDVEPLTDPATDRTEPPPASAQSSHGLDWFVFFVSDIQTGFGPFVAVYLTSQKWTQIDIGLILTAGGIVGLAAQIPAGALVDAARSLRVTAGTAVLAIALSAFALALWPVFLVGLLSRVTHAAASSILGLAIASMSINLADPKDFGRRFGRNASFASIGTALAAAGMGACGYYLSNKAVFLVSGALALPAMAALSRIRPDEIARRRNRGGASSGLPAPSVWSSLHGLSKSRSFVIFAGCIAMFHLANASMLSLAASMLTLRTAHAAPAMVAASILVPQVIVAVLSPVVGAQAEVWGRKPLLLAGFMALSLRGLLFALIIDPRLLVAIQVLDGISAAGLGVLVPLTIADLTGRNGRFNLAQGTIGCAIGIGAAFSTMLSGYLTDYFSSAVAFFMLAAVAVTGSAALWVLMPETRR